MPRSLSLSLLTFTILFLLSCGKGPQMGVTESKSKAMLPGGKVTYDKTVMDIFKNRCSKCHNAGAAIPNWLDYQTAYNKREKINQFVVIDKSMPKAPYTMPDDERKIIGLWVQQGAPKDDSGGSPTTTLPGPVVVPDKCDERYNGDLFAAIAGGKLDLVSQLLSKGACANAKDPKGRPALIAAIMSYDGQNLAFIEIGKALVTYRADVNASFGGASTLDWAEYDDERDLAVILIEKGADVNQAVAKSPIDDLSGVAGYSPLMLTMRNNNASTATTLLENGADVNFKTADGKTASTVADDLDDGPKKEAVAGLLKQYGAGGIFGGATFTKEILPIIKSRCSKCHNTDVPRLNWADYKMAYRNRALIYVRAVINKDMPAKNETNMTEPERVLMGQWIKEGANK